MIIGDIFDALSTLDCPYNNAIPIKIDLDILSFKNYKNNVDRVLINIFVNRIFF